MCVVVQLLVTLLLECVDWSSARPDSSSIVSVGTNVERYPRHTTLVGPALNVTVLAAETALLACVAPYLGEKTVSWIRQRDLAILTSGRHVYTSDSRFSSIHPEQSDLWALQITSVKSSDEGLYQCQVNSEPPRSLIVVLIVIVQDLKDSPSVVSSDNPPPLPPPKVNVKIPGPGERKIHEGSHLNLLCYASPHDGDRSTRAIELAWWREDVKLDEKQSNGNFIINRDFSPSSSMIQLEVLAVDRSDAGKYFCRTETILPPRHPSAGVEATLRLHVVPKPESNCAAECFTASTYIIPILISTLYQGIYRL